MHFSQVNIKALKTYDAIERAIGLIENDPKNTEGGWKAWNSGYETHLLKGAENKIKVLQAKQDKVYRKLAKEQGWDKW